MRTRNRHSQRRQHVSARSNGGRRNGNGVSRYPNPNRNGQGKTRPDIVIPVKGSELEFGVWTESGKWQPAVHTADGEFFRSYLPEDLLAGPKLLYVGATYFADCAEDGIEVPKEIREKLAELAAQLDETFDIAA